MIGRRKLRNQRGDTIVEVLVVLAVLGLALSISFATAQHSLLAARQAQESSQGSVLLQSQLEKLRSMASNPTPPTNVFVLPAGTLYCIQDSGGNYTVINPPTAVCKLDGLGNPSCTVEPCYDVSIKYGGDLANSGTGTFTLNATWFDVAGQGQDSVTTVYRTYK